ncbi:MAG TPA: hypothetical protein VND40_06335 [Nitrososphaerales archaeon]|nr:hypothetical protein [Nitrososphaerales archaeon]
MSDSHGGSGMQGQDTSHGTGAPSRSSHRRLVLVTIIMVGFAGLSFLPALFSRGGTGVSSTGSDMPNIFIPVWLTLTIATVVISMWFTKFLMTYEKYRDSESPHPAEPAPSH